jgi:hypothetical protein
LLRRYAIRVTAVRTGHFPRKGHGVLRSAFDLLPIYISLP